MIIDVHTHAFLDHIASIAMEKLEHSSNSKAYLNGTIADLLRSMDKAGIDVSVMACVATSPAQFNSIFTWCKSIAGPRNSFAFYSSGFTGYTRRNEKNQGGGVSRHKASC